MHFVIEFDYGRRNLLYSFLCYKQEIQLFHIFFLSLLPFFFFLFIFIVWIIFFLRPRWNIHIKLLKLRLFYRFCAGIYSNRKIFFTTEFGNLQGIYFVLSNLSLLFQVVTLSQTKVFISLQHTIGVIGDLLPFPNIISLISLCFYKLRLLARPCEYTLLRYCIIQRLFFEIALSSTFHKA